MIRRLIQRIYVEDAALYASFSVRFPRLVGTVDSLLERVFGFVCHGAFALILGLLLVVFVATEKVSLIVAGSIGAAWVVAVLWFARSTSMRRLTILSRCVATLIAGLVLALAGGRFGLWALRIHEQPTVASVSHPPTVGADANRMLLPIEIEPSITIYIIWLDPQKELRYEKVPNEGMVPIHIPLPKEIERDTGIDEVVKYGFKNMGRLPILSAKLTFDVIFIEATTHVTKQSKKTTKSVTAEISPDALGLRSGAAMFKNGITTTSIPGSMLSSHRETVEVNNLGPYSTAWIYFVNRGPQRSPKTGQ